MANNYTVYMHRNKVNDFKYIGITSKKLNARWRNGKGYSVVDQPVFGKAILEFTWENFEHLILFKNLSREEALAKEIELIALYHTYIGDPECKGYNMTPGGETGGMLGRHHSEESKQRISASNLGKIRTASMRARYSQARKGIPQSEAVKQAVSKANKGRPANNRRPVICIETQETFASIKEVVEKFDNNESIRTCVQQEAYQTGAGYHWAYLDDLDRQAQLVKFVGAPRYTKDPSPKFKKVYCEELDKIFLSASLAAEAVEGNDIVIRACCRGSKKSYMGYHWSYIE